MLILLSPAKTFTKTEVFSHEMPIYLKEATKLNNKIKKQSLLFLETSFKISRALAKKVKTDAQLFQKEPKSAIDQFDGQVYRGFDIQSLSDERRMFLSGHLLILSGLYGLLRPFDGITPYRLDFKDHLVGNLCQFWKPKLIHYIHTVHPESLIINLASAEFTDFIKQDLKMTTIGFQNNQTRISNMALKLLRGQMARYLIENPIETVNQLQTICLNGYCYDAHHSTNELVIFSKEV